MSCRSFLAKLFVFVMLEIGALAGVPMTPEQIRNLMRVMSEPVATQTLKRNPKPGE